MITFNKMIFYILSILLLSSCSHERNEESISIQPALGVPFGTIAKADVLIVELNNDYYSQNMSKSKFQVKIKSVNGKLLDTPILMYPIADDTNAYLIGNTYSVDCYEEINSNYCPRGWDNEIHQSDYRIERFLVMKQSAQQGDAPEPATNVNPAQSTPSSPAR